MNKKLLALAVAVLAPAAVQAAPTVYGKMLVTVDHVTNTDKTAPLVKLNGYEGNLGATYLNSNSSRFGVKGDEETSVLGLKAIYQAEFGIRVDDGTGPFSQRNIFVGLKGDFGEVKLGKFDTPLKESQGKFDEFNDLNGDIQNILAGENRGDNTIQYTSPNLAGLASIKIALMPAENKDVNMDGFADKNLAGRTSVSIAMDKESFYAAIAMDRNAVLNAPLKDKSATTAPKGYLDANVNTFLDTPTAPGTLAATLPGATAATILAANETTAPAANIVRAVAQYHTDRVEVGALVQKMKEVGTGASAEDKAALLSGAFMTGDWKFKAQLGSAKGKNSGLKAKMTALGTDYRLGKATNLTVYAVNTKYDDGAGVDFALKTVGMGIEQKF